MRSKADMAAVGSETSRVRKQLTAGKTAACSSKSAVRRAAKPKRKPREASRRASSNPIPEEAPMMIAEGFKRGQSPNETQDQRPPATARLAAD